MSIAKEEEREKPEKSSFEGFLNIYLFDSALPPTAERNSRQCTNPEGFEPRPFGQNSLERYTLLDFFRFRTPINDRNGGKYCLDKYIFSSGLLELSLSIETENRAIPENGINCCIPETIC